MSRRYELSDRNFYTEHTTELTLTIHDESSNSSANKRSASDAPVNSRSADLHIYVKSGEYFSTLATILDGISDHPELQQIVHDLIYLQQHYKIIER